MAASFSFSFSLRFLFLFSLFLISFSLFCFRCSAWNPFSSSSASDPADQFTSLIDPIQFDVLVPISLLSSGGSIVVDIPDPGRKRICRCARSSNPSKSASSSHSPSQKCPFCGGSGRTSHVRELAPGFEQAYTKKCTHCDGTGEITPDIQPDSASTPPHATAAEKSSSHASKPPSSIPHPDCPPECSHGPSFYQRGDSLEVDIPEGLPAGSILSIPSSGNEILSPDGSGKVLAGPIEIRVTPDFEPFSPLADSDIHLKLKLEISLLEAINGFQREIKSPNGNVYLVDRSGLVTQPEFELRLDGGGLRKRKRLKGWTRFWSWIRGNGEETMINGDLIVEIYVKFPKRLSPEQKEKVKQLLLQRPPNPSTDPIKDEI